MTNVFIVGLYCWDKDSLNMELTVLVMVEKRLDMCYHGIKNKKSLVCFILVSPPWASEIAQSTDIGVSESSLTIPGTSLQRCPDLVVSCGLFGCHQPQCGVVGRCFRLCQYNF
jgi:hypothetical protein